MGQFIKNLNMYLSSMKIKHSFISLKTGIDPSKLSRILNSTQDITSGDMEKIAGALGKKPNYFMSEDFQNDTNIDDIGMEAAFYVGEPGEKQRLSAQKMIDLIKNADEVLSVEIRLMKAARELTDGI